MDTPWSTAEQTLTDKTGIGKRNITRQEVTNTETLTKTYELDRTNRELRQQWRPNTRQAQDPTGETDWE